MKKLLSAAAVAALASAASQASAQVLYEPFNYTTGATLDSTAAGANKNYTTSGTYWSTRGTQSGLFTVGTGLSGPSNVGVPPLPATMGGSEAFPTSGTNGRTPDIGFGQTFTTEGDYYYSFLMKTPTTLGTTSGTFAGFSNFAIPTPGETTVFQAGLRYIGVNSSTYRLALAPNGGTVQDTTGKTLNAGDTVLVVARYHINPTGRKDDTVSLWIDPTAGFGENGSIPAPDAFFDNATIVAATTPDSVDAAGNAPMLAGFVTRSFSSTAGFQFDEVRVDNTWAGVLPDGTKQYHFNNAAGGNWSDANTWNDYTNAVTANQPNATGAVANFGSAIAGGGTITVDGGGKTVDTLNFSNAGGLTVAGDGLTFTSNTSAAQVVAYAGSHTINSAITSTGNLSFKTSPGTSLTIGGTVTMSDPEADPLLAKRSLGVYGTGTVTLGAADRIGDTARLEVRSGTLDLNTFAESVDAVRLGTSHPNNGSAISTGVLYNGDLASGAITNGTITANSYDLQSGTISAVVAGANGVAKNHAGRVTLSGNNTYTGNTVVNGGVLTLSGTNSNPVAAVLNSPANVIGTTSTLAISSDTNLGATGATVTINSSGISTSGTLQFDENMTLASDRTITALHTNSRLAAAPGKTANIDALITGAGGVNVVFPFDPAQASTGSGTNPTPVSAGALGTTGGVIVLRNTGNNYTGNTTVSGGRLLLTTATSAPGLGIAGKFVTTAPPDYPRTSGIPSSAGAILSVSYGGASDWSSTDVDTLRTTATWGTSTLVPAGTFLGFDTGNATATATYASSVPSGAHGLSKHGAGTLVLSGDLAQSGAVVATGGTLVLSGNNTYAAQTRVENGATLRVTSNNALGGTGGNTWVRGGGLTNANLNSTLELDGSAGDLTIAEPLLLEGKGSGNTTPHVNNIAGNNTLTGDITFDAAATFYNLRSDAGSLTINGNINNPLTPATTQRLLHLRGTASGVINGAIQNTAGSTAQTPLTKHDSGTWTLNGTNTYLGSTTVNDGTLNVVAAAIPVANAVIVNGGTYSMTGGPGTVFRPGSLTINGGQASVAASGSSTLAVGTLAIGAGKLVTNDNDLIVDYTGASVEGQVRQYVINGRVPASTSGIFSTPGSPDDDVVLAVADNAAWGKSAFNGINIDTDTVVGKYTYFGDANLDGKVTGDDYVSVDANLGTGDSWLEGDFNMNGVTTGDDYVAIDANLGKGTPTPLAFAELKEEMVALHVAMFGEEYLVKLAAAEAEGFGASVVPEPGALSLIGLGAVGLLGRRRRQA